MVHVRDRLSYLDENLCQVIPKLPSLLHSYSLDKTFICKTSANKSDMFCK